MKAFRFLLPLRKEGQGVTPRFFCSMADDWTLVDLPAAQQWVGDVHGPNGMIEFNALLLFLHDGRWKKRAFGLFEEVLPHGVPRASIHASKNALTVSGAPSGTARLIVERLSLNSHQFRFIAFYPAALYGHYIRDLNALRTDYSQLLNEQAQNVVTRVVPMNNIVEQPNGQGWLTGNVPGWNTNTPSITKPVTILNTLDH